MKKLVDKIWTFPTNRVKINETFTLDTVPYNLFIQISNKDVTSFGWLDLYRYAPSYVIGSQIFTDVFTGKNEYTTYKITESGKFTFFYDQHGAISDIWVHIYALDETDSLPVFNDFVVEPPDPDDIDDDTDDIDTGLDDITKQIIEDLQDSINSLNTNIVNSNTAVAGAINTQSTITSGAISSLGTAIVSGLSAGLSSLESKIKHGTDFVGNKIAIGLDDTAGALTDINDTIKYELDTLASKIASQTPIDLSTNIDSIATAIRDVAGSEFKNFRDFFFEKVT